MMPEPRGNFSGDVSLRSRCEADIARLTPPEAVDYLLEVIDGLTAARAVEWHMPGVHLTPTERRMLAAIASGRNRTVSRDAVYAALTVGRPDCEWPDDRSMDVYVCLLRKKLAPIGIAIRTVWGQGWCIEAPEGTVWPWEARA